MVKISQNSPDATRVNPGVLIGSGQSHVVVRAEKASVRDHFSKLEPCVFGDVAHSFRSADLPMHRIAEGGKLYRTGDVVVAKQQNTEIYFRINQIFLLNVNEAPHPVINGDTYQLVWNPAGGIMRHPLSDTPYVKPFESGTCRGLKEVQREIMLFQDVNGTFAVVDPYRKTVPFPPVIVPVYPQIRDMIFVKENNDKV